jgi:exodeoxyribonuclease X
MLNEVSADQLLTWSQEPGLLPRVPTGVDRGKAFCDLREDALMALAQERDADIRFSAQSELQRRGEAPPLPSPLQGQQTLL